MKYLDEVIEASISDTYAGVTSGVYQYTVCRKNTTGNTNSYTTIFVGNMYHEYGTRFILDITDIVRNDVWVPDENTLYNKTDAVAQNIRLVDSYKVIFQLSALSVSSPDIQVAKVYRYPHRIQDIERNIFFDYTQSGLLRFPLQGSYNDSSYMCYKLTPHYPYISTDNYRLLLSSESSSNVTSSTLSFSGRMIGGTGIAFLYPSSFYSYKLSSLYNNSYVEEIEGAIQSYTMGHGDFTATISNTGAIIQAESQNDLYCMLVMVDSNGTIITRYTDWIEEDDFVTNTITCIFYSIIKE